MLHNLNKSRLRLFEFGTNLVYQQDQAEPYVSLQTVQTVQERCKRFSKERKTTSGVDYQSQGCTRPRPKPAQAQLQHYRYTWLPEFKVNKA
jgi:hypothetical protein